MTIYLALLRAINLAGHKPVAMADLRELLTKLGFTDVRSALQSGNLVFRSKARSTSQIERLLESDAEKRLALQTDFFVRTAEQWKEVIANNPFRQEAERDPSHLVAFFLKDAPDPKDVAAAPSFSTVFQLRPVVRVPSFLSMSLLVRRDRPMPFGYTM